MAIRAFGDVAATADVAMIYYAGHRIESAGGNYLVPVDAKLERERDLEIEAVDLNTVMRLTAGARRLRVVVPDACRTPPSSLRRETASRSMSRGLARVVPGSDSLIVYNAKAGTTAADGSGANSPFATAMARRIVQPGKEISLLFRLVRDDVLAATDNEQEPFTYGSLSGKEFYFIPGSATPATFDMEGEAWGLCRDGAGPGAGLQRADAGQRQHPRYKGKKAEVAEAPVNTPDALLEKLRRDAAQAIRRQVAPYNRSVTVALKEKAPGLSKTDMGQFSGAVEFAGAGRMDRACSIFETMNTGGNAQNVALLYNLGVCQEVLVPDRPAAALEYHAKADQLLTKPDRLISDAYLRTKAMVGQSRGLR